MTDDPAADPLAATLPLLWALPAPVLLHRLDGTVAAASAVFEDMVGGPVDGLSIEELGARFQFRSPTGRDLRFDDLCRDLRNHLKDQDHMGDQPGPEVAVDLRDRRGLFRAMIATGAVVRSGGKVVGVVVLFTEVTRLIQANGTGGAAKE